MENNKKYQIKLNIIIYIVLIGIIVSLISNKNIIIGKEKQTTKEMTQSTLEQEFNDIINQLNAEHTDYMNYIQSCKTQIATEISNKGVVTSNTDSFETIINNIANISSTSSMEYIEFTVGGFRDNATQTIFSINPSAFSKVVFTIKSANQFSGNTIYSVNGNSYTVTNTYNNIGLVSEYEITTNDDISITLSGTNYVNYNIKLYYNN